MSIDLPSLEAIILGQCSLCGTKDDASCSLTMRSWIEMNDLIGSRSSKSDNNQQFGKGI